MFRPFNHAERTPGRFQEGSTIRALVAGLTACFALAVPASAQAIQDLRGRSVQLPAAARRVLIDDGRFLIALSLIHKDPVSLLAAWPRDINRIGEKTFEQFRAKFPAIERVPQVASSAGTFSLEKVLAVKPDVAILSLGRGPSAEELQACETAGIKVVFIDFFNQPFENLEPSLRILGKIVGRQAEAEKFIAFRKQRMDRISSALRANPSAGRPKVFLEAHAGISGDCCNSPGKGNIGDYIEFVGGHNIGADVLPGASGKLNIEYVISQNPRVYIATGGPHLEATGGLIVGQGYAADRARASFVKVAARPAISSLTAIKEGRAHALSHQLLNSPLDILAVEALARWIHPTLFAGVDPTASMKELNERFLAVPLEGSYWIDLR